MLSNFIDLFMDIVIFIWMLPQNLLGLLVILFTGAKKNGIYYQTKKWNFGVSLGEFIIFGCSEEPFFMDIAHEYGHFKQSMKLGPLYLFIIGIPSVLRNIYDGFFHCNWDIKDREKWYYNGFPEKQADKLGGVNRFTQD